MPSQPVYLVDVIKSITDAMTVPITGSDPAANYTINFEPGRSYQIIKSLNDLDYSITMKGEKYPLVAMIMPVTERRGTGFYATAVISRIVIATITNSTDDIFTRYQSGGTFKEILYPCYYEFLRRLAWSPYIIGSDPDMFVHTKIDNPGEQPVGNPSTDFIDSIELFNLELIFNQIKTC